jgi:hypothetical protein
MALNASHTTMGLPSASGYQVYNTMTQPVYTESFMERLYGETLTGDITDTGVVPAELRSTGSLAYIPKSPTGNIRTYTLNQELEFDQMNNETTTFAVDKAFYWNLKLDKVDYKQIKSIGKWITAFQEDCMYKLKSVVDHGVLQDMVEMAHICNKGNQAGIKTRRYKLGQVGAPLALSIVTGSDPLTLTSHMMAVLTEQHAPDRGRFIIWHPLVQTLFLSNPILSNAYASGQKESSLISGKIPNILGAIHYFSDNLPTYSDVINGVSVPAYPVIFGLKEATGYVNQLTDTRIIEDSRHFGMFWQGLNICGWGVMRPELMGMAYVTINF